MHKGAYTGGIDFTQYFKDKNWSISISTAFSQVKGTKQAIESTQTSSARYYQRPGKNYAVLDPERTSLSGNGGRMMISKLNGHLNLMGVLIWKTPGFEINDLGYVREADQVFSVLWAGYNQWEPKGIYRRFNINGDVVSVFNFGGDNVLNIFETNGSMTLKNYWNVFTGGNISGRVLDAGILRGGPMMETPGRLSWRIGFSSDNRKKLGFEFFTNYNAGFQNYSNSTYTSISASYKPTNYLSLSFGPGYSKSFNELQYVTVPDFNNSDRYVFASIDQKTISASLRVNLNLSPDLTLHTGDNRHRNRWVLRPYILNPMADTGTDLHILPGRSLTGENLKLMKIDE
jgi:hypothetical protein